MKRHSYLFVAFAVGKWTQETCSQMMGDFKRTLRRPIKSEKIEIFKYKAKSRERRHVGFRAQHTRLLVEKISN